MDAWINRMLLKDADAAAIRMKWQEIMATGEYGKQAKEHRRCILIGADITKGIVPMEANIAFGAMPAAGFFKILSLLQAV